jgi:hypothetical protein
MLRKLLALAIVVFVAFSCGTSGNEEDTAGTDSLPTIVITEFDKVAANFVGKEVKLEGTVTHICEHGGEKLNLMGADNQTFVKIYAGETVTKFETTLEGSKIVVFGKVDEFKMDEEYLNKWETEVLATIEAGTNQVVNSENEHVCKEDLAKQGENSVQDPQLAQIQQYRDEIATNGKGYISFYSVTCSKFEEQTK